MEVKRITPEEARDLLESDTGYVYLDVRTTAEFEAGHVVGARNIPVFEPDLSGRMQPNPRFVKIVKANFSRNARCITGCQMGGRSLRAAQLLLAAGFTDVLDMRGGYDGERDAMGRITFAGWASRGLPTSTESAREDRYDYLKRRA